MMSRDPRRCCEAVRSAILATAWLLVEFGFVESVYELSKWAVLWFLFQFIFVYNGGSKRWCDKCQEIAVLVGSVLARKPTKYHGWLTWLSTITSLIAAGPWSYWFMDLIGVWKRCSSILTWLTNRQLSDVNRDGALSLDEFCTAMHLVVLRRNDIELPDTLPPVLQPYTPLVSSGTVRNWCVTRNLTLLHPLLPCGYSYKASDIDVLEVVCCKLHGSLCLSSAVPMW